MNIEDAPSLSRYNRVQVEAAEVCGCYFCMRVYLASEVVEFEGGMLTALCPHCGIDAVLPGVTDEKILAEACERWFTEVVPEEPTKNLAAEMMRDNPPPSPNKKEY